MTELYLIKPNKQLETELLELKKEYTDCNENQINGTCGFYDYDDFNKWLAYITSLEKDKKRDGTHSTTYLSIRKTDQKIIGTIQLRHTLTDILRISGGNIGYGIRPSERGKGYGKEQLHLLLVEGRKLGLEEVLITCDEDNIASISTAKSCGGKLINQTIHEGKKQNYYMIKL